IPFQSPLVAAKVDLAAEGTKVHPEVRNPLGRGVVPNVIRSGSTHLHPPDRAGAERYPDVAPRGLRDAEHRLVRPRYRTLDLPALRSASERDEPLATADQEQVRPAARPQDRIGIRGLGTEILHLSVASEEEQVGAAHP